MTFDEFANWINVFTGDRPAYMRLGQWAFITLHESFPEIADDIRGRDELDPFAVTSRLPDTVAYILKTYVTAKDSHCI